MNLLTVLTEMLRLPDYEEDEMPSTYLAGYVDAKLDMKQKMLALLKELDANVYVRTDTPYGLAFTRLSLESLEVAAPVPVPPSPGHQAAPPDTAF